MNNVFVKLHPLDDKKKLMTDWCYSVKNNMFIKTDLNLSRIDERGYFTIEDNKIKKLRRNNYYTKLTRDEFARDTRNLRRRNNEAYKAGDILGQVIGLVQPHRYMHKKGKPARHKWIFDVLNNTFLYISNEDYIELGFNKFGRGFIISFSKKKGKYVKLGQNGDVKLPKTLDEIQAQEWQGTVADNLLFWQSRLKYNNKCARCVNILSCGQPKNIVLASCRKYKRRPKE
jgi:hypothetical protein